MHPWASITNFKKWVGNIVRALEYKRTAVRPKQQGLAVVKLVAAVMRVCIECIGSAGNLFGRVGAWEIESSECYSVIVATLIGSKTGQWMGL